MDSPRVNPVFWSCEDLVRYGQDVVLEMARKATGTATSYQVLLGRCLLAINQERWYESVGCSSAIHFATNQLGYGQKEALRIYRVALELKWLPRLSRAAENGTIQWGKLREIVSKASAETESLWLELAKKMSCNEIQELVARTEKGEWPKLGPDGGTALEITEIRCRFEPNTMEILEHVTRKLSEEARRPLSTSEVIAHLCAERLAKGLPDEKLYEKVEKSVKLRRAHRRKRDEFLIQQARALAAELGLQEPGVEMPEGDGPTQGGSTESGEAETGPSEMSNEVGPTRGEACSARVIAARYARIQLGACPGMPELQLVQSLARPPLNPRLKFNPKARTPTPAQRAELLRRDGYRCCVPGCCHRLWLEAHHLIEFCTGGQTDWENLRMVCSACHRNIHKGLLKIIPNEDGTLTFTDAAGRDLRRPPDMEIAGWLNYWEGWLGQEYDSHQHKAANGEWGSG